MELLPEHPPGSDGSSMPASATLPAREVEQTDRDEFARYVAEEPRRGPGDSLGDE
jgi:hypothetical protein